MDTIQTEITATVAKVRFSKEGQTCCAVSSFSNKPLLRMNYCPKNLSLCQDVVAKIKKNQEA